MSLLYRTFRDKSRRKPCMFFNEIVLRTMKSSQARMKSSAFASDEIKSAAPIPTKSDFIVKRFHPTQVGFLPPSADLVEKSTHCLGRQMCAFFCLILIKRSKIEVKLKKRSTFIYLALTWAFRLFFTIIFTGYTIKILLCNVKIEFRETFNNFVTFIFFRNQQIIYGTFLTGLNA